MPIRRTIAILVALAVGFGAGWFVGQAGVAEDELPDEDLVLYEPVSMAFPVEGARFTESFEIDAEDGCDKELLKRFLDADPHRKRAWLEVQGITEAEFEPFIDRLRSAVLLRPTPVTNHGCFAEGEGECPFSLHSVLAAGTLVLVDPEQDNRPVVKCRCGNPLDEPQCPPNCDGGPTPTPSATPERTPFFTDPVRTPPPRTTAPPERTPPPTPTPCPPGTTAITCAPTPVPRTPPPIPQ